MKANIFIKILVVLVVAVLAVILIAGRDRTGTSNQSTTATSTLSAVESGPVEVDNGLGLDPLVDDVLEDDFGVDVDSPTDTMRTLTLETQAVRKNAETAQEENERLQSKIEQLLQMEATISKSVEDKFNKEQKESEARERKLEESNNQARNLISKLESRLESLQTNYKPTLTEPGSGKKTANGYEIDAAQIPDGLGYSSNGRSPELEKVVWINPVDVIADGSKGSSSNSGLTLPKFDGVSNTVSTGVTDITDRIENKDSNKEARSIKYYTIPANGTLIGSVSMTALLGRIPVGGSVTDAYPFKIMVGGNNLASNGINIPGVSGIVMSGTAKGDWTLSCVSGEITSMTFTFEDGTITTLPSADKQSKEPIAWFSDANGIPCVTGKRITNAVSYLSTRVGLTGVSAYADAVAEAQLTYDTDDDLSYLSGDLTKYAASSSIAEGINDAADWLDERQESSFDAIYVPPGTDVAVHITQELRIDYDPEGRKVNHYAKTRHRSETHLD